MTERAFVPSTGRWMAMRYAVCGPWARQPCRGIVRGDRTRDAAVLMAHRSSTEMRRATTRGPGRGPLRGDEG